jgi:hypothetical protein
MIRRVSGQRFRSSSEPSFFPATLCGWQGNPAVMMSTTPLSWLPSRVDMSAQIGASSRRPSWILALMISWGYRSHSTYITVLVFIPASRSPRLKPPYPVKRLSSLSKAVSPFVVVIVFVIVVIVVVFLFVIVVSIYHGMTGIRELVAQGPVLIPGLPGML